MVGWNWRTVVLLCGLVWVWVAGCGPTPKDLRVEPDQPMAASQTDETDKVAIPAGHSTENESAVENDVPSAEASTTAVPEENPPLIHKVRWGHETLYSIARWYTGKAANWRRITAANPKIHPRRMRIGDIISIPGPLLTTRQPMPENYLKPRSTRNTGKTDDSARKPPSLKPEEQAPPLYGPVGEDLPPASEQKDDLPDLLETLDE